MFHREPRFHPDVSFYTDSYTEFPDSELDGSIVQRFESVVERFPDRIAIESSTELYTFAGMNKAANRLARAIGARSSNTAVPVALLFDHSAAVVVAIFACLKAGRCYVVLDPAYPIDRILKMHSDSGAELVVTSGNREGFPSELSSGPNGILDFGCIDPDIESTNPVVRAGPGTAAILLYTSGSTGTPKAATHTHANVLADVRNLTNLWRIGCADRFVLCTSISFANSVRTIYASLLNGASLYPFDLPKRGFRELADWLSSSRITVFRCVPTMFRRFVASIDDDRTFPDVRIFSIGGETVRPSDVQLFNQRFSSKCVLTTAFGPTECLTVCSCFLEHGTDPSTKALPIGYPLKDKTVLILDDSGVELPANEIGEIAVRSRFITSGYWRKPDLNENILAHDARHPGERIYRTGDMGWRDEYGCFWHAGRRDFQIKIRGFRIEAEEIEDVMLTMPDIQQVLVTDHEEESTGKRLVAYFVPREGTTTGSTQLRNELASRLPDYMVPSIFVPLSSFPTLPNGKIDRSALPSPPRNRPDIGAAYSVPRNNKEAALAEIWRQVLQVDDVGIDDPFLELGGDSLLATMVINHIIRDFGIEVTFGDMMEVGTIREIAQLLELMEG